MSDFVILPFEIETTITNLIENRFKQDNLSIHFQNPLLREEMLDLLDRYCTVVYYPLEGEDNNGFRLKKVPFADGSYNDFVFINTAQTLEKQVFTAAHELGHIWNVDEVVINKHNLQDNSDTREHIINRFAAVLLMPENKFRISVQAGLKKYGEKETNTITYGNLLRMIVRLMNQFFAPMKAVVIRMIELKYFRDDLAKVFFGHDNIPEAVFVNQVYDLCVEYGYTNLVNPTRKKYIEGLAHKLDFAERNNLVSPNKIKVMRDAFDLEPVYSSGIGLNDIISLNTQEGKEALCDSTNTPQ